MRNTYYIFKFIDTSLADGYLPIGIGANDSLRGCPLLSEKVARLYAFDMRPGDYFTFVDIDDRIKGLSTFF